jgi:hypothetical protein
MTVTQVEQASKSNRVLNGEPSKRNEKDDRPATKVRRFLPLAEFIAGRNLQRTENFALMKLEDQRQDKAIPVDAEGISPE